MRRSRLEMVKDQIFSFFDSQNQRVFKFEQLNNILREQWDTWELPKSTTLPGFITFLEKERRLWEQRFDFSYRPITLLIWGQATVYEMAMSLRPQGYLSHSSAMRFHGLTSENKSPIVYVNAEQKPKPRPAGGLEQGRIDAAFQRAPRVSNNKVKIGETVFYLLSGMHTGGLDVTEKEVQGVPVPVRVASIERTLIDAVVRPAYSGSVHGVLEVYRRAAGRANIEHLVSLLQQLQYIYPYHQAIGFYLERSGSYDKTAIDRFTALPQDFNFYLDYEMGETSYSEKWRLYYPAYLDRSGSKEPDTGHDQESGNNS